MAVHPSFNTLVGLSAITLLQGAAAQSSSSPSDATTADTNQCDGAPLEDYNLTLAIISVFVVLILSFIGAAFPALLALKRHPYLILTIKLGSFAGSGVLLATGFGHMLPSANENLSSPCLSQGWLDAYPAWAFLFAVVTAILLQVLDYILAVVLEPNPLLSTTESPLDLASIGDVDGDAGVKVDSVVRRRGGGGERAADKECQHSRQQQEQQKPPQHQHRGDASAGDLELGGGGGGSTGVAGSSPPPSPPATVVVYNGSPESIAESEPATECNKHARCKDQECIGRTLLPAPEVSTKTRALSGLMMSEVSICTHSIIIGMTLGVTASSQFTALFIAILFHQLLEGVALGSNAAEAGLSTRNILLLAATYSLTTPIGIAAGIGVRNSLNTNSAPMLLTTGILDAISAGTLIFLALGDHMNAMKSQAGWLRAQSLRVQLACFSAFFLGAAVLLVLALWA